MADGKVIVTLSVQDAEALRAWQRARQGIGAMQEELRGAKKATADVGRETQKLSKTHADGFRALSALGRESYQQQSTFSRGLAELDRQRSAEASANLKALKGQSLAAWGQMGEQIAAARQQTAGVTAETQKLSKAQADGFQKLSALGRKAYQDQSAWAKGLKALDKQRTDAAIAASKTLQGRLRSAYAGGRAALKEFTGEHAQSNETLAGYAKSRLAEWASYATAVGVALKVVRELIAANKEVRGEEADVTFTLDESFRRLQVQGQFTEAESAGVRQQIFEIAERQAAKTETVSEVAKQLISSGFDRDVVLQGGAAEELTKGMQASAMSSGENPAEFTEAITQFLMAQTGKEEGEEVSAGERKEALSFDNLSAAVRQTQGLFLRHNMQFADLTYLARAAPGLSRAGLGMTEQLAAFTRLRDVLKPEQAGTELRNIVSRMQTAGASDEKMGALAEVGLKAEDIDLVGESFDEALKRLRDALANISPEKQAILLKKVFEEEGAQAASVLIADVPKLAQYRKEAADTSAFAQAHATATSGYAAGKRREEVAKQRQRFGGEGADDVLVAEAIEAEYSARGSAVQGKYKRNEFEAARGFGMSQADALGLLEFGHDVQDRIRSRAASAKAGKKVKTVGGVEIVGATTKEQRAEFRRQREAQAQAKRDAAKAEDAAREEAAQSKARREAFAERAKQNAAADQEKGEAKEQKKQSSDEARKQKTEQSARKKIETQAASAGKRAQTEQAAAAAEGRHVDALRKEIQAARAIQSAGETRSTAANPWGAASKKGKRRSTPRVKSAAARLREKEAMRKLEGRLEEAERKRAEHEKRANELMDQQNKLLAQIEANTGGKNAPARIPPQRPPAQIGGN